MTGLTFTAPATPALWLPSGIAGRAHRAGVFDRIAEWRTAESSPKPDGIAWMYFCTVSTGRSGFFIAPSMRPRFQSQRPVCASDRRTCQLPPSRACLAFAIIAPNAIR